MSSVPVNDTPPTVRQVYALAAALCEKVGEPFPDRRDDASDLIERIRREIGHPAPTLSPPRRGTSRRFRQKRWPVRPQKGAAAGASDGT